MKIFQLGREGRQQQKFDTNLTIQAVSSLYKRAKIGHFLEMEFVGKVCCQVAGMYQNLKNVSSL